MNMTRTIPKDAEDLVYPVTTFVDIKLCFYSFFFQRESSTTSSKEALEMAGMVPTEKIAGGQVMTFWDTNDNSFEFNEE